MSTNALSHKDIKRSWYQVDAKGKILGRVATEVATLLLGKNKPNYVPYLDTGDYVVVVNAKEVRVTGKKEQEKIYFRHSGYPGGDRRETLAELRARRPEEIVRHAVWGMVPKTKLGKKIIKKLYVYSGAEHPYRDRVIKSKEAKIIVTEGDGSRLFTAGS